MQKFIKTIVIILCCLSLQYVDAQNYPVNKIDPNTGANLSPNVPTNERYVIGVNANCLSCNTQGISTTPDVNTYNNSPLSWRANRIVNSDNYTPYGSTGNLNNAIQDAITAGYRNIFIQSGKYFVNGPILLNIDNVTIEGESNLTIIKPSNNGGAGLFPAANSIFEITGKNNVIKNLSIDCSAYTPGSGIASAIELKSGAENNTFRDINIENISTSPANQTFANGAIYLNNATSYIYNNLFENMLIKQINKAIVLNSVNSGDGIRNNIFRNVKIEKWNS